MRSNNNSGCLTAFVSSFSRIMLLFAWIARPAMMDATFRSFIIPCLGFMFLPFTTLMYVFLVQGVGNSVQGLDWLWLFLAVLSGRRQHRRRRGSQSQSHPGRLSWLVPAGSAGAAGVDGAVASALSITGRGRSSNAENLERHYDLWRHSASSAVKLAFSGAMAAKPGIATVLILQIRREPAMPVADLRSA